MQFIGPWEGRRDCKGVRSGLRYEMWQDSFVSRTLYLAGPIYGDYLDTLAGQLVSFNRMRFSRQMLQDTALEVEGWAERWQDSLLIQLDVRGGIGSSTTCKWLLKKR
ncbi:MAG: hypothetical protein RMJ66_03700 [Bacteroidia bacterium]|nr:hypothetical protein [Bacteroidia bacterium]MDW8134151.1 hypothetical protein [Bacteroidia bacterium]